MALVINLGRITVVSKNKDNAVVNVKRMLKEGSSEDQVFNEMMAKCYDCFKICLGDVQVYRIKFILRYCRVVSYCIVLYCIVSYCIVSYCIASHRVDTFAESWSKVETVDRK